MNKYVKIGLSIAVIAALGVTGAKKIKEAKVAAATTTKAKIYPIVVDTITPKVVDAELSLPYLAEIENDKDVMLSSRIAARIISIKKSSTTVKKGEIIARLDTTTIKSNLKSIENQINATNIALKNLMATHKRTTELLKVQGASIEQSQKESTMIATTEAKLASLQQKEIELKNNLSYAVITSPVDGVIAKSMGRKGAMSMPGKPLAQISAKNGFYLRVRLPQKTSIKGVIYNHKTYKATALGTTFHGLAEYKVYTGQSNMTTGDRIEVAIVTFHNKATFLPFDAILNRDGKSYVLVVQGHKAVAKQVHILQIGEQGLVVSDKFEGQKIVKAKPDILLKLLSGYKLQSIKGE